MSDGPAGVLEAPPRWTAPRSRCGQLISLLESLPVGPRHRGVHSEVGLQVFEVFRLRTEGGCDSRGVKTGERVRRPCHSLDSSTEERREHDKRF